MKHILYVSYFKLPFGIEFRRYTKKQIQISVFFSQSTLPPKIFLICFFSSCSRLFLNNISFSFLESVQSWCFEAKHSYDCNWFFALRIQILFEIKYASNLCGEIFQYLKGYRCKLTDYPLYFEILQLYIWNEHSVLLLFSTYICNEYYMFVQALFFLLSYTFLL